jgi:hypothetical protein
MVYCSNCHSPSKTGIRPLHRYFPEGITEARMQKYVKGVLTTGNIAYMPKMPMLDSEVEALSAYLVMNKTGGQTAITAAIKQEVDTRNRALVKKQSADKVATLSANHSISQEVK